MTILNPQFAWKAALAALVLGATFAAANIYLGHGALANLCFGLAVLCDLAFTIFAVLWVMSKSWLAPPEQGKGPPGLPPGMKLPQGMKLPPGMVINPKPGAPPSQQPQAPPKN